MSVEFELLEDLFPNFKEVVTQGSRPSSKLHLQGFFFLFFSSLKTYADIKSQYDFIFLTSSVVCLFPSGLRIGAFKLSGFSLFKISQEDT